MESPPGGSSPHSTASRPQHSFTSNSQGVSGIVTTSSQLIADMIAKGRRQMLVPREHPPDPRPENFQTRCAQHQMGCNVLWRHADDPFLKSGYSLAQKIVALVVLKTKLDVMHDDFMLDVITQKQQDQI